MKNISLLLTIALFFMTICPLLAQGPPGPPATPIDGGLSLLLAAGGIYGVKKIRDQRKQKKL
ncbi:MAG: hypothetical protein AAFQ94_13880 [Bacteroidota bacterium]